jgi:hypothetical protein
MMRRLVPATLFTAVILLGAAPAAVADPGNGNGQSTFPMICDGMPVHLTIGGGVWSAATVDETDEKFLPNATRFQVLDAETGEVLYEEVDRKAQKEHSDASTCVDMWEEDGTLYVFTVHGKKR